MDLSIYIKDFDLLKRNRKIDYVTIPLSIDEFIEISKKLNIQSDYQIGYKIYRGFGLIALNCKECFYKENDKEIFYFSKISDYVPTIESFEDLKKINKSSIMKIEDKSCIIVYKFQKENFYQDIFNSLSEELKKKEILHFYRCYDYGMMFLK